MSQTQFLLFLLVITPMVSALMIKIFYSKAAIVNIISKFSPLLFLATLIGLCGGVTYSDSIILKSSQDGISLALGLDRITIIFLWLLDFLWLVFVFYSHRFLKIAREENIVDLKLFFALFVAAISLIIISKNLISLLLFYGVLTLLNHFFALRFLYKKYNKTSQFFSLVFYLQLLCFFTAIFLTHNIVGNLDNIGFGVNLENLSHFKLLLIVLLYFLALFALIILPLYGLFIFFNTELIFTYIFYFLSYGFVAILMLMKVINIFNFENYFLVSNELLENIIQFFFLISITIASSLLIFSDTIKKSFTYLTFQQLIFALFAVFIFIFYDHSKLLIPLISFSITLSLVFITVSNLMLYINNSQNKSLNGLFYDMKINSIFLIFAIAALLGLTPSISTVQEFFIIKIILANNLFISKLTLVPYFISLIIFGFKLLFPLFYTNYEKRSEADLELIKKIDGDSGLVLSGLSLILAAMFAALILPFLFM